MSSERGTIRRLKKRRREAEERFDDLRRAVEREVGWAPRGAWLKPAVAFAVGMALAMGRRRGRSEALEERTDREGGSDDRRLAGDG